MYKLKRIVFYIMLISFIIKANECYGMETNENKGDGKTVMEKIKALPYPKIFIYGNKLFFSLAHSIINNFYELETLEMNKVYSLKKYLCLGYRLQPEFMLPFGFLDFNINILAGAVDTTIFFYLCHSLNKRINIPTKIFYVFTSFLNINLNIKIKGDFYISINIVGIMRTMFMAFLLKKQIVKEEEENNNNINDNQERFKEEVEQGDNDNIIDNSQEPFKKQPVVNNNEEVKKEVKKEDNEEIKEKEEEKENKVNNNEIKKEEEKEVNEEKVNNGEEQEKNNNFIDNSQEPFKEQPVVNNEVKKEDNEEIKEKEEEKEDKVNNNEIKKEEDKEKVKEIYDKLEENYYISSFKPSEEIKKKIVELNYNEEEIQAWVESIM